MAKEWYPLMMVNRGVLFSVFESQRLIIIVAMWMAASIVAGTTASLLVMATAAFLLFKRMYLELFLGFAVILFVADSREIVFRFARDSREVYVIIMAAAILLDKDFYKDIKLYTAFLPFFIIAAVALYYSPVAAEGPLRTFSYFLILFVVPPFVARLYGEYGKDFFRILLSIAFVILVIGLLFIVINPGFAYLSGRFRGLFGNPNGLGLFVMLFVILFEVIYDKHPEIFKSKDRLLFLGVAVLSLILAASRTAMMGLIIFYSLRFISKISKPLVFVAIFGAAVFAPLIVELIPVVIMALGIEDFARLRSLEVMGGRAIAIEFAWGEIQNNFWLGRGFGYSNHLFDEWSEFLSRLGHQGGTHNTYVTVWLNTGFIGLLLFIMGWFSAFLKAYRKSILTLAVGCTVLFSIFFEEWLASSLNAFTIILLIILTTLLLPLYEEE